MSHPFRWFGITILSFLTCVDWKHRALMPLLLCCGNEISANQSYNSNVRTAAFFLGARYQIFSMMQRIFLIRFLHAILILNQPSKQPSFKVNFVQSAHAWCFFFLHLCSETSSDEKESDSSSDYFPDHQRKTSLEVSIYFAAGIRVT